MVSSGTIVGMSWPNKAKWTDTKYAAKSDASGTDTIVNDLNQHFEKPSGTSGVPEWGIIIAL